MTQILSPDNGIHTDQPSKNTTWNATPAITPNGLRIPITRRQKASMSKISKHTNTHPALHAILGTNIHFSTLARVLTVPQENAMQQRSQVRTHSKAPLQSTSAKHLCKAHCSNKVNVAATLLKSRKCKHTHDNRVLVLQHMHAVFMKMLKCISCLLN